MEVGDLVIVGDTAVGRGAGDRLCFASGTHRSVVSTDSEAEIPRGGIGKSAGSFTARKPRDACQHGICDTGWSGPGIPADECSNSSRPGSGRRAIVPFL